MDVKTLVPTKKTLSTAVKFLIFALASALVVGLVYWFWALRGASWSKIKELISQESGKYVGEEVTTEKILLSASRDILTQPHLSNSARTFAKAHNIPIERVVVDNAIAMSKNLGFISIPKPIEPPKQPNTNSNA